MRVKSGLKIVADGDFALTLTMNELKSAGWLAKAKCSCGAGHHDFIDHAKIAALGLCDEPLSAFVHRLKPSWPCGAPIEVVIVDPWRDNLDE